MNAIKINSRGAALIVAMIISVSALSLTTANGNTVGVVDPNNQCQTTLAAFGSSTGTWGNNGSTSIVSEATFNMAVGTAYANNLGGVEDFEAPFTVATNTAFNIPYAGGGNALQVTPGTWGTNGVAESGDRIPISGTKMLWMYAGTGQTGTGFSFNFSPSNPGDLINGIGFCLIDRTNRAPVPNNVTVTVTLDNGDTVTATGQNDLGPIPPNSQNNIFFGFLVPTNRSITNVVILTSGAQFDPLDDLGFVMVGPTNASLPAAVSAFSANATIGVPNQPVTLSWSVTGNNLTSLTLNPGHVNVLPFTSNGAGSFTTNLPATVGTNVFTLTAVNFFGSGSATTSVAVARTLVALYDPKWDANDLDKDAVFAGGTGSGSSAALVMGETGARQFFANTYLADQGGVDNFETRPVVSGQPFYITYGPSDSLVTITGQYGTSQGAENNGRIPISGITLLATADGVNLSFNFALANPSDKITQVALGVLERNRTVTTINGVERVITLVTGTANLDNGDTITSTNTINTDAIDSDEDIFFGFAAPAGRSITNLTIVANSLPLSDGSTPALYPAYDDLAVAVNGGGNNGSPKVLEFRANNTMSKVVVVPKQPVPFNWIVTTNLTSLTLNPGNLNLLSSSDPNSGIGTNVVVMPAAPGNYTYTLTATNGSGSDTQTWQVSVVNTLVGVINPPATTNQGYLDMEASFSSGTGLGNNASLVLGTNDFQAAASNAFSLGLGGVENFETQPVQNNVPFYEAYDANDDHLIISGIYGSVGGAESGGRLPLSGTNILYCGGGGSNVVFNLALDNPLAKLTDFGFGLIANNLASMPYVVVAATATFENGDTLVESGLITYGDIPSDNIWFGFQAPSGHSITNVQISLILLDGTPAALFPGIDDVAFVVSQPTVPRITSISRDPVTGKVTLTWTSDASGTYTVEATGNISTPRPWPVVASGIPSGGTTTSYTETGTTAGQRFYIVIRN